MALQSSGQISLNEIHIEAGGSSGSQVGINDTDVRGLIGKSSGAQMSFSEWYGASAETTLTSGGTVNGQAQRQQITVSSFISSGGTLVIPSNIWVWSDATGTAALTVNIPCTIKNYGKIIGRGGNGNGNNGGNAIRITSSGVTIINYSGAYIAGGGGGGGGAQGAGGAGGGNGAGTGGWFGSYNSGAAINGTTSGGGTSPDGQVQQWGSAGAGGGGGLDHPGSNDHTEPGGGGGRVLPGSGGSGVTFSYSSGGAGGSAGNAGGNGSTYGSGGGGGWGASGGRSGGSGGAAISKTTSYTLSNSGTIYGST